MKVCGIIAEYNPFHNGHRANLEEAKKLSGADYCVAVMSGHYAQRGEPAVFDPYIRTRMALLGGADLVLQMPAPFSSASARDFAGFGIRLLSSLGVVTSVAFGSEFSDAGTLSQLSGELFEASGDPSFYERIRREMASGETFPVARETALRERLPGKIDPGTLHACLSSPNALLGLEYMLAARRTGWDPEFIPVPRVGDSAHADINLPDSGFASAGAIRKVLRNTPARAEEILSSFVPEDILPLYKEEPPVFADDFSLLLNRRILDGSFDNIVDLGPSLAARLKKTAFPPVSYTKRIESLKTRQITYTRVSRALLHLLLDYTEEERDIFRSGEALYGKILGFRKDSAPLLSAIKNGASVPLISRTANAPNVLTEQALLLFKKDLAAAHMYEMIKSGKGGTFRHEFTRSPAVI